MYRPQIVSFDAQLAILRISGDEDRTTSGRRRRPFSAALNATRDVIVDLSGLTFADPSLMIDLACLAQRLRARAGAGLSRLRGCRWIRPELFLRRRA